MEIWDLYTADRRLTGETHIRGTPIPQGRYHLVVHVWIRNTKEQYLISQRSASRPTFPLMWETVGGSALAGESSREAAIRETLEEVGIDLTECSGTHLFSKTRDVIDGKPFRDILDVWQFHYDGPVSLDHATTDETAQAIWMYPEEIRALLDSGQLVHTLSYFFTSVDTQQG